MFPLRAVVIALGGYDANVRISTTNAKLAYLTLSRSKVMDQVVAGAAADGRVVPVDTYSHS